MMTPFCAAFVVDCSLLRCQEPWFALSALGHGLQVGPEVLVVLPSRMAARGDAQGWAVSLAPLDDERTIAASPYRRPSASSVPCSGC